MSNDTTTTAPKNTYSYAVPKQRADIVTDTELFNKDELKVAASNLDDAFSKFASILMEANDVVNSRVNASCDECVFGAYGAQLLETWNANVPTFSEFKSNFESWSRAVSVIATRDENTEAVAKAIYNNRATGADLTTASGQTVSEMREDIILSSAKVDQLENTGGGKTYRYYDENGILTTRYENEDGEVWMQHASNDNGKLTSTRCYDANGNYSEITFKYDENGKRIVSETDVKFYDENGELLETRPDTFKDTGYLVNNKAGNDGLNPDGTPIKPEEAPADVSDGVVSDSDQTAEEEGWTSYEDAKADGATNIYNAHEFAQRNQGNGVKCTNAAGETVVVDNYQDYLDVMYEKYGPGSEATTVVPETGDGNTESGPGSESTAVVPETADGNTESGSEESVSVNNSSDEYFIQRGDECTIYGEKVTFLARDGSYNYYSDANGNVFVDADGGLRSMDMPSSNFSALNAKDPTAFYGAVSTTADGASAMNLPTDVSNSNAPFDEYGMSEYVDPLTFAGDAVKTYTTNEGFRGDLTSGGELPQVIEFDHKLESPGLDIAQPDIKPLHNDKVTLVYDDRSGMYYQVDDTGTYVRDSYGYTPEELAEFDIEKHN